MTAKIQVILGINILIFCAIQPLITQDHNSLVITESPQQHCEIQWTAQYLKPSATNTHFAAEAVTLPAISPHWNIYDICKKHHFGFDLFAKIYIHKNDSSIFTNWQHFKSCDNSKFQTNTNNMVGPFFEIGPDASPYFLANGIVNIKFNEFNIDYGQNICFANHLHATFFAGISFVQLCQTLSYTYTGTLNNNTVSRNITTPIKFSGAGPQCGLDFSYNLIKGFALSGKIAAALLNGNSCNHTTYTSASYLLTQLNASNPNIQTTSVNTISLISPTLFERIGLSYQYKFENHCALKAEIGFQAQIYCNVLESIDIGSQVITPPVESSSVGVYARTFQRNFSNFALTGAYFLINCGF